VNFCTSCGQDFGSVGAFDRHRVGDFPPTGSAEYTGPIDAWTPNRGRRCLTVVELLQRSWTRDSRGRWRRPNLGAPWAASQKQATTEKPGKPRSRGESRRPPRKASTRLPDSRKQPSDQ
jgi:hypothetical protein